MAYIDELTTQYQKALHTVELAQQSVLVIGVQVPQPSPATMNALGWQYAIDKHRLQCVVDAIQCESRRLTWLKMKRELPRR